jgi:hypothetical protein
MLLFGQNYGSSLCGIGIVEALFMVSELWKQLSLWYQYQNCASALLCGIVIVHAALIMVSE